MKKGEEEKKPGYISRFLLSAEGRETLKNIWNLVPNTHTENINAKEQRNKGGEEKKPGYISRFLLSDKSRETLKNIWNLVPTAYTKNINAKEQRNKGSKGLTPQATNKEKSTTSAKFPSEDTIYNSPAVVTPGETSSPPAETSSSLVNNNAFSNQIYKFIKTLKGKEKETPTNSVDEIPKYTKDLTKTLKQTNKYLEKIVKNGIITHGNGLGIGGGPLGVLGPGIGGGAAGGLFGRIKSLGGRVLSSKWGKGGLLAAGAGLVGYGISKLFGDDDDEKTDKESQQTEIPRAVKENENFSPAGAAAATALPLLALKTFPKFLHKGAEIGAKQVAETGGKSLFKSILKKIPGIGAVIGTGLALNRLSNGDYLGALGEFGSGLFSLIPGIGTGISIALDAGLAARDIAKGNELSEGDIKEATNEIRSTEGQASTSTPAFPDESFYLEDQSSLQGTNSLTNQTKVTQSTFVQDKYVKDQTSFHPVEAISAFSPPPISAAEETLSLTKEQASRQNSLQQTVSSGGSGGGYVNMSGPNISPISDGSYEQLTAIARGNLA